MKRTAGLWIDHRKAIIVVVTDEGEEVKLIVSKVEKQLRRAGDSPLKGSYDPQTVPADDSREEKIYGRSEHLLRCGSRRHSRFRFLSDIWSR